MSVGKLGEFDVESGNWTAYVERLEMYFIVNGVKDEAKMPTLITVMGESAYELLATLASPKKPAKLSFEDAVKLMQGHLQPAPSPLAERYRFRQRRQLENESISSYLAELKRLARYCEFGTLIEDNIRDQFVCGIRNDVIRQRLFAEGTLISYNLAVRLANSLECAERDSAATADSGATSLHSVVEELSHQMHALQVRSRGTNHAGPGAGARAASRRGGRQATPARAARGAGGGTARGGITEYGNGMLCVSCGARDHSAEMCKFKNYICSKCGAIGHLRRACVYNSYNNQVHRGSSGRAWSRHGVNHLQAENVDTGLQNPVTSTSDPEDYEEPVMQMSLSNYKPVSMPLQVHGRELIMEIDTGSALSCISKQTYELYYKELNLLPCSLSITFYDGSKIKPLGYVEVNVCYGNVNKILDLYVIDRGTTTLLGRQWLSELSIEIPKFCVNNMNGIESVNKDIGYVYSRYCKLFDGSLGRFTGGLARLHVPADAAPVFCRARPLPYAMRERVDSELDAMLRAGVIEPVDCSEWATPLVIVNKPDGAIRICADYKVTLNRVLSVDKYPVPKIDDLLSTLGSSRYFSKIDLSQAYNQVCLDDTKKYTVINTHRGLFMYNRLVYGLASSPGIFQRVMTSLLSDIPGVTVFLDDVLMHNETKQEHVETLDRVLSRLERYGLRLKREKCEFFVEKVKYLGYIIDKDGISADPQRVKPILELAPPKDVSELRSFLGMVNFYGRFIKNLSSYLQPLYQLLKKETAWVWGKQQSLAFKETKRLLSEMARLTHYAPEQALVVTADASSRGLGAVLAQRDECGTERPVMFASRALTPAEINYSQIHKEALAIVFAVKKFHQYVFGRRFTIRTDHKPLVSIFGPYEGIPNMTASRLQRWALILTAYSFEIEYVSSDENVADALSRMILAHTESSCEESYPCPEQTYLHFATDALLLNYNEIKTETSRDPLLSRIMSYIRDGWPRDVEMNELKPFFNRRRELYEELGCIMWGHRVVIPKVCVGRVLKELHEPHMGITKTKQLARSYVWWAGIDEDVEATCRACAVCAQAADAPPRHTPCPWPWPERPWSRLHLDFLGPLGGATYLVIVDAYSKWIEITRVHSTSASCVIPKMRELWARFGIPKQTVSDNGPPFSSEEFQNFLKANGVEHIFSAPYHPASNGAAENAVKICKRVIKKAVLQGENIEAALNRYLLIYRNTEHCTTGESPAKLLQGRSLRTRLDCLKPERGARVRAAQRRQQSAAGGSERSFTPDTPVWYRIYGKGKGKWARGTIVAQLGDTDYSISSTDNSKIHRHVDQIRLRSDGVTWSKDRSLTTVNRGPRSHLVYPNSPTQTVQSEHSPGPSTPASGSGARGERGAAAAGGTPATSPTQATVEEVTQGMSSAARDPYPKRLRRPPTRYGFEID